MITRLLFLMQMLPLWAFLASCGKSRHPEVADKSNVENSLQEKDSKIILQQWYGKQNLAAELLNNLVASPIDLSFKGDTPLEVIEIQRSAIGSIDDLQVLSDERKEILVKWCRIQIEAADCLNQISRGNREVNLKILDFDSILEAQEQSIRQNNLQDKRTGI